MSDYKKIILIFCELIALIAMILLVSTPVFAFRPAAHIVILEKVKSQLPKSSIIRQSIESFPEIAYTGANGPDIGYLNTRGLLNILNLGYSPWGDKYHYHLVGTFAATQLQEALASREMVKIAWAAGWLTHVIGDIYGHGIFVNPEAGVFLDNPGGRAIHQDLENWAEPVVWMSIGGQKERDYNSERFLGFICDKSELPAAFTDQVSWKVYGSNPGVSNFREWYNNLRMGLSLGLGYTYMDFNTAMNGLSINNRYANLLTAVSKAVAFTSKLLTSAEQGDYSSYSNEWNLDAGFDGRPIGSLTVQIKTSNDLFSGTDADIYFGLQLKNGKSLEKICDKNGYNDFEKGDDDQYYFYIGDMDFKLSEIQGVFLKMGKGTYNGDDWKCDRLIVWINGYYSEYKVNKTFTHNGDRWREQFRYR